MGSFNIVVATEDNTVVTEYEPKGSNSTAYQSEAALEAQFIKMLTEQGYEYLTIHGSDELIANLRIQLEKLNNYKFTDSEWKRFLAQNITKPNEKIEDKSQRIQEDYVQVLKRDDGTSKNISLIDKKDIFKNSLQVINQYVEKTGNHENRYDVTILVNGLPLVHVELKRRGVALKEAFNQIDRYQRDSFWANTGLYDYVQIFVISNGTNTKYYSNSTRFTSINEKNGKRKGKKTSNSFEFTSFWADANNKVIPDLVDFTRTFFARHTILNILTKYCVFTSEKMLMVMRPYQIVATERILNRILIANNNKFYGTVKGGGYIWHTTGSGKTLTSFKTAQLASKLDYIDKVLFVVDRKDLDYQTMKEYDRFEKGAANSNRNTAILTRQLEDKDSKGNYHEYKIIVTTIQKLDNFIKKNPSHEIYNKHVVLIFDECHRSQFGDMHLKIIKNFKKYYIFGFTGTPIFAENAGAGKIANLRTTEQAFGDKLHTYTIVDAINDKNVLPFRIDYINTIKQKTDIPDQKVEAINTEAALLAPERIKEVTKYILDHFDQKTRRNGGVYGFSKLQNIAAVAKDNTVKEEKTTAQLNGFNSILAVASIDAAKLYYTEFKKQIAERGNGLKVATIFSYSANEEEPGGFLDDENSDDTSGLDQTSRDFLDMAIADYNTEFSVDYDTSAEKFPNYYKDLSLRMKNREVDLLIVVNMFLTGFDATTLNTLWVDKNLKQHGLIQAFSRTNRILNSIKTYGNIVCFRDLEEETNAAIALFGDKDAGGVVLLRSYNDYYYGYTDDKGKKIKGYEERIAELLQKYPLSEQIIGEKAKKDFIILFGNVLRLQNILSSFDEFDEEQAILTEFQFQNYTGLYLDLRDEFKNSVDKENINDDLVFEMELVKHIEVNIDYILMLVAKYHESNCTDKEVRGAIDRAIKSSLELRSKKELIEHFIDSINTKSNVMVEWEKFVRQEQEADLDALVAKRKLNAEEARKFMGNAFRDGEVKTTGTDIDKILPPVSRFAAAGSHDELKKEVFEELKAFFEKYFGLGINSFIEEGHIVEEGDTSVSDEDSLVTSGGVKVKVKVKKKK